MKLNGHAGVGFGTGLTGTRLKKSPDDHHASDFIMKVKIVNLLTSATSESIAHI